jgi:hypothetical protein
MRYQIIRVAALAGLSVVAGCIDATSEAMFTGGRDVSLCDAVYPVCKGKFAGCTLDTAHYIQGTFPGTRKFLVETTPGDWVIKVQIFLENRLSPGTETEINWYEPGCAEEYRYQLSKDKLAGDLFEQAGKSQVFVKERAVAEPGDHLVEIYSDATCRYDVRVDIDKQK